MNQFDHLVFSDHDPLGIHCLGHNPPDPSWCTPLRCIDDYEVVLITHGRAHYTIDHRDLILNAGDAVLFTPGRIHEAPSGQQFDMLFFHFSVPNATEWGDLAALAPELKGGASVVETQGIILPQMQMDKIILREKMAMGRWQEEILALMRMALQERDRPALNSYRRISFCLLQILQLLTRQIYVDAFPETAEQRGTGNWPLVQQALFRIRERATQGLNVRSLAEDMRTTPQNLIRHFKACLGESPHAKIQATRLEQVEALMRDSSLSLKEIARATGARDLAQFSRWFKAQTEATPTDYRNRL